MAGVGCYRVIEELEPRRKIGGVKELPIACTLTPAGMVDRASGCGGWGQRACWQGARRDGTLELRFARPARVG